MHDLIQTNAQSFREAMSSFPSGVAIVTTADHDGKWWGFTATSFSSVSMDPPLVLVCLANSAECFPAFSAAQSWSINFIPPGHTELATHFATRGVDKFARGGFRDVGDGIPVLDGAFVTLRCTRHDVTPGGDHIILIGEVTEVAIDRLQSPTVYFQRAFHELPGSSPANALGQTG